MKEFFLGSRVGRNRVKVGRPLICGDTNSM